MSSQPECNANKNSNMDSGSTTKSVENASEDIQENKNKCPSGRFAKRNYRKRSDSQSSVSSASMEDAPPEQANENTNTNANENANSKANEDASEAIPNQYNREVC